MSERLVGWQGVDDESRVEHVALRFGTESLTAVGAARASWFTSSWELEVAHGWISRALRVTTRGFGWSRSLELTRSSTGEWTAAASGTGETDLPDPGIDVGLDLSAAIDCDLGLCPLTNTMPIRRLDLLSGGVPSTPLVMALVEVPSLRVVRSEQHYASGHPGRVRFRSERFETEFTVDDDGVIIDYPGLARRIQ